MVDGIVDDTVHVLSFLQSARVERAGKVDLSCDPSLYCWCGGQKSLDTPIDARIIHIADAYDAMTTDRSYRRGLTHERAIEILFEYAGMQFDPRIVPVFASLPREMMAPNRVGAPDETSVDIVNTVAPWEIA